MLKQSDDRGRDGTRRDWRGALLASTALAALIAIPLGRAQAEQQTRQGADAPTAESDVPQASDQDKASLYEIIVTGSARPQRRFDVSYAVNSLSEDDMKTLAPLNFADMLGELPGIHTEPTGGEVQNITRNRGIPTDDGLIMFQQDGLPLFEDIEGNFFRGDDLNRLDLMDERVEVVRGGPAPIYSGQAAAIVNNITRTGGPVAQGEAQVTYGTTGLLRLDAFQSGPLSADTYFAVGGFLRRDDGARPDGFPNDQGGQIRANVKHDLSNGSVRVSVNYLDDHNVFYLPIPINNPNTGQSLNKYINFFTGTLNTPALDNVNIKYVDGSGQVQNINTGLQNGRHTQYGNVGLQYDGDLDGYEVSIKSGITKGSLQFDALYSVNNPVDANAFSTSSANFSINGLSALGAAQAAYGNQVSRIGYAIAGTNGQQLYNPYAQSGLVITGQYRYITSDFYSDQSDFSVTRKFDTGLGSHDVKAGIYGAAWGETDFEAYQNYLMQVDSRPQLLDLVAYSATGTQLGMVTRNGNTTNSNTLYDDDVNGLMAAFYLNDTWTITDQLRVDAGFRHESYFENGYELGTINASVATPGSLITSTQAIAGPTQYYKLNSSVNNWTAGVNYDINSHFGGYARLSHLDIPPSLISITYDSTEEKADQYEAGIKTQFGKSYLYLTGFYTAYNPLTASYVPYDPSTGLSGKSLTLAGKAQDLGVEADGSLNIVHGLSLNGSFTVSSPQYQNLVDNRGQSYPNVDGKQIVREPKLLFNVRPQYEFVYDDTRLLVYGRYDYTGQRYVDLDNTTALPAYGEFSAGLTASLSSGWALQLVGTNLTDAHGLTEGNPRTDFVSGQGAATAFYARPIYGRDLRIVLSKSW